MSDEIAVRRDALGAFAGNEGQKRMVALADEFKAVCAEREKSGLKKWIVRMGPGLHPVIEAWQYIGQRAGVIARTVETRAIHNPVTGDFEGYSATAEVQRLDTGDIIGRAEQVCFADEILKRKDTGEIYRRWNDEEGKPSKHAIMGMAQTRAQSRALASVLRFLMEIAGIDGTPAEEMEGVTRDAPREAKAAPKRKTKPETKKAATTSKPKDGDDIIEGLVTTAPKKMSNREGREWYVLMLQQVGTAEPQQYSMFSDSDADTAATCMKSETPVRAVLTTTVKGDRTYLNLRSLEPVLPDEDDAPPEA